jgi:hypothetical protein
MADLGTIGTLTTGPGEKALGVWYVRTMHLLVRAGLEELLFARRDDTDGNPAAPCQRQERFGTLRDVYWPVTAGTRTLTVRVKHSGHTPVPIVRVKANPDVGVLEDHIMTPTSSTDWQDLTLTLPITATGVLWVWREVRSRDQRAYALWDHLTTS